MLRRKVAGILTYDVYALRVCKNHCAKQLSCKYTNSVQYFPDWFDGGGQDNVGRPLTGNRTDCAGRRRGWRYDRIRGGLLYARRARLARLIQAARLPVRAPALGADRY